jgi:hypothetical protein
MSKSEKTRLVTKSVRLSPEESKELRRISEKEFISEAALMRKLICEGLARYRLESAISAYMRGELDLSSAARYAGVSVYQIMNEIQRRGIAISSSIEKFLDGLQALAESFDGSDELLQAIARMRSEVESERSSRR